jgi:serine/threonine-protein kinase
MELIEGGNDLKDYMAANGPLTVTEVLEIAEAVGRGLQAIHDAGMVHRDIKPANVMRTGNGTLKITDFGLARAQDTGQTLTQPNSGMGTISYMAPEQAMDARRAGPQSDLYSLGATLYQALTASLPFPQKRVQELLDAITEGEPQKIEATRPDCPPALSRLIERLLAREPDDRYAGSKDMLESLAKIREGLA